MRKITIIVSLILLCLGAHAQTLQQPIITDISKSNISYRISGNTVWEITNSSVVTNHETRESFNLLTEEERSAGHRCSITDINEAGTAAIGRYDGQAAYWSKENGGWSLLEMPEDMQGGITAMSDNGKYAIGNMSPSYNEYIEEAFIWDLTTGKMIVPEGIPELDMQHEDQGQNRFTDISPDGRYILGTMSFSYVYPVALFNYIYDREEKTYHAIGFTPDDLHPWQSHYDGLLFTDFPQMSQNGKWVTGKAYMGKEIPGSQFLNEYMVAFRYNIETQKIEVFDTEEGQDITGYHIDDNGNVFGATPTNVPLREWYIHTGKYWVSGQQIYLQKYGIDFYKYTGFDYTGTPSDITGDGRYMLCLVDPNTHENYLVQFPNPVAEDSKTINLLGSYKVSPEIGSAFTTLKSIDITFTRDVNIIAAENSVELRDDEGNIIQKSLSIKYTDNSKNKIRIGFRTKNFEQGKKYTIVIPAGILSISEDASMRNEEIRIEYTGLENKPVYAHTIYPADGSAVAKIDYSSNPVMLTMNAYVSLTDTASAYLYSTKEDKYICNMILAYNADRVAAYPASTQYLFSDNSYVVVIEKGSITDLTGGCPNEEIRISYNGTYVREINSDDQVLFSCDFNKMDVSLQTFMLYEGDHNTPAALMQSFEFDQDNTPWNFSIRESSSTSDYCAASHSVYSPTGKSDDWMVIPQLHIPDEQCILSFDAQSYRYGYEDRIKVIIYENDESYNYLSKDIVEKMRSEGKLVVDEIVYPGLSEEGLSGDWTNFTVNLAEYSGKNIYIAFLNDNEDQNMIFVDNVIVEHNIRHTIALSNSQTVINKESETISGLITINSKTEEYSKIELTLKNSEGNVVSRVTEDGLNLKKGDTYKFTFSEPLPLVVGENNAFSIETQLDDYQNTTSSFIKDLMFETTKHVVLEEYTGADCGNCPMGILAIENLEKELGDRFIPVSIHTYNGDRLSAGLGNYTTYLGLLGAPSGIINRSGIISYPMWQNPEDTRFYFNNNETNDTWSDMAHQELATFADIDVDADVAYNAEDGTANLTVSVRSAINASNLNLNLFYVILEDKLPNYQTNYYSKYTDPIFGEWGEGGIYGSSTTTYINNDVARSCSSQLGGTGGYFPQEMKAGNTYTANVSMKLPQNIANIKNTKVVVMLIDANTDKMINAARTAIISDEVGIQGTDTENAALSISRHGDRIVVSATEDTAVTATLYSLNGQLISENTGNKLVAVSTNGYKGATIVKVVTDKQTVVRKLVIR
ncbi:MAG: Omp28-related outer membrane protein [Bacteroides sp.]|nr:Omp28-related outer membrane protein [Roseburia sp.]MCM1347005.1 Omp28-related outer membrane protein [Bacteroides sp.]MCM1421565.1 Omp28-related outer membrane protein [Bacteroides sp.]